MDEISVAKALKKGQWRVNVPVLLLFFSGFILSVFFVQMNAFWPLAILVPACFGGGWLWWSLQVVRWRLWAFEQVRNVHELKKRAIEDKLIWPDNSGWNKTEIWTAEQRARWQALQVKFDQPDVYVDWSVPAETDIYMHAWQARLLLLAPLVLIIAGIFLLINQRPILGGMALVVGVFLFFVDFKNATRTTPVLSISAAGITLPDGEVLPWQDIRDLDVRRAGHGRTQRTELQIATVYSTLAFKTDDWQINRHELYRLLRIYATRHHGLK